MWQRLKNLFGAEAPAKPLEIRPGVGVGALRLGDEAAPLAAARGLSIAAMGYSDLGDGSKVQCFDGQIVSISLHTGVLAGRQETPDLPFTRPAATADGLRLGANVEEALRHGPDKDKLERHSPHPLRTLVWSEGLRVDFLAETGEMHLMLIFDPDGPLDARMEAFDEVEAAVWSMDGERIEGARDLVVKYSLARPLAALYPDMDSWPLKAALVGAAVDDLGPAWTPHLRDFLSMPLGQDDIQGDLHFALVGVLCHLEGEHERFNAYWEDAALCQRRAAELRAGL
ncbi:MAG: hypothetical protein H6741_13785 [Alphaproteobacteria bacterium]|nr:hypothetical protein [Alphaproteobacteria bacterium]